MKNTYVKPEMQVEEFLANQYVAACKDKDKDGWSVYEFECDGGDTSKHYAVKDSSGSYATISGFYLTGNTSVFGTGSNYHPCGKTHTVTLPPGVTPQTSSDFLTGYHLDDPKTRKDENISVIIWTDGGKNVHCTSNTDMTTWHTAKS